MKWYIELALFIAIPLTLIAAFRQWGFNEFSVGWWAGILTCSTMRLIRELITP